MISFFVGLFIDACAGALAMALIAGGKCEDFERKIEMERCRRDGDCKALEETISTLRRSNRALKSFVAVKR